MSYENDRQVARKNSIMLAAHDKIIGYQQGNAKQDIPATQCQSRAYRILQVNSGII